MLRVTKSGWLFLAFGAGFYLASLTSQSGLLLFLVGILLGCGVLNAVEARRMIKGLDLKAPPSVHLGEGQRLSQPWKIINHARWPASCIAAESPAGTLFRLAALPAGGERSVVPELSCRRRGVYAYSAVRVSSAYPFGLMRAARTFELPGEVIVYPAVYETESPAPTAYDVMIGGKFKGKRRSPSGSDFSGVRPWDAGDPLKHIHWKASSRGQGLMVKTFEEDLSGRVSFIVDCGHTGDDQTLDDCLRAAGSLMFAALDAGHHVEWIDLASLTVRRVPPFSDGHEILDALARLELAPRCVTADQLRAAAEKVFHRSALSFVLTGAAPEAGAVAAELRAQHRNVSLYLPASGNLPPDLADVPVFTYTGKQIRERP